MAIAARDDYVVVQLLREWTALGLVMPVPRSS